MYEYFRDDCGIKNIRYKGIDLVEGMIETAQKKYPEAEFEVRDIIKNPLDKAQQYDYVFLCGVFNQGMETDFMKVMLQECFSYCKKGLAFNFISSYVNFYSEERTYHKPQEIFEFCVENLSRKIDMHHHYAKCDVSMFVYR